MQPHQYSPQGQYERPPNPSKIPAIVSLVLGIAAVVGALLPWVGVLIALAAIVWATAVLAQKRAKGMPIAGVVLGGVGFTVSLLVTVFFSANLLATGAPTADNGGGLPASSDADSANSDDDGEGVESGAGSSGEDGTSTDGESGSESEPEVVEDSDPVKPDLEEFDEIDERALAMIAKDPDSHVGDQVVLYGVVDQFDSFTGRCTLRMSSAAAEQEDSWDYEHNTYLYSGDGVENCPVLDDVVQDDHLKIWATIAGSYEYDTTIGGTANAVLGELWQTELLAPTEY